MREFVIRVAWYFGIKLGSGPRFDDQPHSRPSLLRRIVGCILCGTVLALILDAIDGFHESVGALLLRAGAFALAIAVWSLVVDRWAAAEPQQRPR